MPKPNYKYQPPLFCDDDWGRSRNRVEPIPPEKQAQLLSHKLDTVAAIQVSGGPFHNMMRAGTYGEIYDEAGWKYNLGVADIKPRSGVEENPMKCKYSCRVLANNWVEDRRDRWHIKYDNAPRLSEYGYVFKSEYATKYANNILPRPYCNKARDLLLNIPSFPTPAHPGHQGELMPLVVEYSIPKPEDCCLDEQHEYMKKCLESEKRYERHDKEVMADSKDKEQNKCCPKWHMPPEEDQCDPPC